MTELPTLAESEEEERRLLVEKISELHPIFYPRRIAIPRSIRELRKTLPYAYALHADEHEREVF